jgi:hypothetical protein
VTESTGETGPRIELRAARGVLSDFRAS